VSKYFGLELLDVRSLGTEVSEGRIRIRECLSREGIYTERNFIVTVS